MEKFYRFAIAGLPCILLLLIPLCGVFAQVQTARSITTGPNSHGFYEYLPAGYSAGHAPYPLMVFLSGEWQQGNGTAAMLPLILQYGPPQIIAAGQWPDSFKVAGRNFQFVIISPQFTIWESETDIDDVITYALAHYNVDPTRVYLTGYSAGGGMTWAYAGYSNAFANKLAAIVPVAAAIGINDHQAHTIAVNNLPVYATHNIDDSSVGYQFCAANVAAVNHAAPPPAIPAIDTIFPNRGFRHNAWTVTYCACFLNPAIDNYSIYQWMLQHSRTSGTAADRPASTVQELQISPNPASGLVHIHLVSPGATTLRVSLSDMQGKTWHVWSFRKQETSWDQRIDLSSLPMGTYELQLSDGTMREVRTILKQ